jgi:hypothetical protein
MKPWPAAIEQWGSTPEERTTAMPCDGLVANPDAVLHRALDVDAPAAVMFRWLCQMRAAPYSYDWLDNRGRRSPRTLTPGLEEIEVGQRWMIFRLVGFEPGRSLTLLSKGRVFGRVACTYSVEQRDEHSSRLLVRMLVAYHRGPPFGALMRAILPPGDLVMMRRQLLNLASLAEAQVAREGLA